MQPTAFCAWRGVRLGRRTVVAAVAILGFCLTVERASAITANSTVTAGDVFTVNNNLNSFSQIENGVRAGGAVTYGANDQLGGIFADASGLYFAGNPNASGLTVERISIGQTASTPILTPADFAGGSGGTTPVLRDLTVLASGAIFTLYANGAVDQFTPAGGGSFTRSAVGSFTGFTSADRGSGHQLSSSANGDYLLTSSRSQNRVWSLQISTGMVQQWSTPTGLLGPVTGTQLTLSAESVLDPVRGDRLLVPMSNDGLYEVDFDPATGAFPTANPRRLTSDTVATFIDAVGFDETGALNVSLRDTGTVGSLREFTQTELVAASGGSAFNVFDKAPFYSGTDARIARDLVVIIPEPAVSGLVGIALAAFAWRRRCRRS
jgi:hypothetical protein